MAVVIETTLGDLTVDLFTEQRPRTCLNFLKLCKMKYYNYNLFHTIQHGFIAQTGDPSGESTGGQSIWGVLEGPEKRYFEGEKMPKIKHTVPGLLSMVTSEDGMVGSQFFFTLASDLNSLDAQHCIIGEVTEGHDILRQMNETICDSLHRPYQDVRITHTVVLEDPFNDPKDLRAPSRSPSPTAERLAGGRIAPDEEIDETKGKTEEEILEIIQEKEAKARATILEIVGDLPDADMAPPENVLFVCKLNPVTSDDDLEIIFSRFGKINCCEVIRDKKTGDSLQYAFIEFDNAKSCEDAYFKMDNVLIDDRRIHVDFSQSISKIKWRGKGKGVVHIDDSKSNQFDNRSRQTRSPNDNRPNQRDSFRDRNENRSNDRHNKEYTNKSQKSEYSQRNRTENNQADERNQQNNSRRISSPSNRKSPNSYRERSPNIRRKRSPISKKDRSPERRRERSPERRRVRTPDRRRDRTPERRRLRSPQRRKDRSPDRRRERTPDRRRDRISEKHKERTSNNRRERTQIEKSPTGCKDMSPSNRVKNNKDTAMPRKTQSSPENYHDRSSNYIRDKSIEVSNLEKHVHFNKLSKEEQPIKQDRKLENYRSDVKINGNYPSEESARNQKVSYKNSHNDRSLSPDLSKNSNSKSSKTLSDGNSTTKHSTNNSGNKKRKNDSHESSDSNSSDDAPQIKRKKANSDKKRSKKSKSDNDSSDDHGESSKKTIRKKDKKKSIVTKKKKRAKYSSSSSDSTSSSSSEDSTDSSSESDTKKKSKKKSKRTKIVHKKKKSKRISSSSSSSDSSSSSSEGSSSSSDSSDSGHERSRKKSKNKKSVREKLIKRKTKK